MEKRKGRLENKTVNIYQHQVIFAREPRFGQHQYPVSLTEIQWLSLAGFLASAPIQKPSATSAPHSSNISELEEQTLQQSPLHIISLNRIRSVSPAQTLSSRSLSLDRSLFTSNLRLLSAMLLSIPQAEELEEKEARSLW